MPSLSLRRAWIEIVSGQGDRRVVQSLSLRRAWIEINGDFLPRVAIRLVALLTESVD